MSRTIVIAFFCLVLTNHPIVLANEPCDEDMENEAELDAALEWANFVFVATVSGENETGVPMNYKLHGPTLKGTVPPAGELIQADVCWGIPFLNGEAIVLLFMDSLEEPISRKNWVLVVLGQNEPGFTWVADWLAQKTSNNALHLQTTPVMILAFARIMTFASFKLA